MKFHYETNILRLILTVFSATFLLQCVMQRYDVIMDHVIISIQFFFKVF
jgi:hypothetical protein